jgi:glycosyltransferase involved in cell wall biosynthesis
VLAFEGVRDDMPATYGRLDVLALTSQHEGTPLAVLEAMACGLPIVATNVGGVPELVCADESGVLVAPGDPAAVAAAVLALLDDPRRRSALSAAARSRVIERFALRAQVVQTAALLRAVAAERTAAARGDVSMHVVDGARRRAGLAG